MPWYREWLSSQGHIWYGLGKPTGKETRKGQKEQGTLWVKELESGCLHESFYCRDEAPWPKQLWEKRVCLAYTTISLFHIKGSQNKNSNGRRSWCRGRRRVLFTDLFFITCSACFLIEPTPPSPGMVLPTMGWTLPNCCLIKKMPWRLAYNLILRSHFLIKIPSCQMTLACVELKWN